MAQRTRLKVEIGALIERIEAHIAKIQADHDKALAAYEKALDAWKIKALTKVRDFADSLGDIDPDKVGKNYGEANYYYKITVPRPPEPPHAPRTAADKRTLAMLRASADTSVSVTIGDDMAHYFN